MINNYLVVNTSKDPFYNLALEEYLLTHYEEGNIIMLWQNENTIVIGNNQNILEEINQQYVKDNNIKVVRRSTGGGAVYHDLGNLNYTIITDINGTNEDMMRYFAQSVIDVLREYEVEAQFSGRNDIMIENKKISGTAQRIYKNRVLHHGCILFDSDLQKVSKCLNVKSEKFKSKSIKSVRSRVGNVTDFLKERITLYEFGKCLEKYLLKDKDYKILHISASLHEEVKRLAEEKYKTWQWNFAHPIKCSVHNSQRYEGGTIEVYMNIRNGRIEECQIFGDFMALRPVTEISEALTGCRHNHDDILNILKEFAIDEYFGAISIMDVVNTFCCFLP